MVTVGPKLPHIQYIDTQAPAAYPGCCTQLQHVWNYKDSESRVTSSVRVIKYTRREYAQEKYLQEAKNSNLEPHTSDSHTQAPQ